MNDSEKPGAPPGSRGWLRPLNVASWQECTKLLAERWCWLDLVPPGLHVAPQLPGTPPPGLTHAWGWAREECFRIRVDAGLPHGVVGAVLSAAPPAEHDSGSQTAQEVTVTEVVSPRWPDTEFRVGLATADRSRLGEEIVTRDARYVVNGVGGHLTFLRPRTRG